MGSPVGEYRGGDITIAIVDWSRPRRKIPVWAALGPALQVADHLVSILAVRVEPRERPRDLEPVPPVEVDCGRVAHPHLEFDRPHRPERALPEERVHQGR